MFLQWSSFFCREHHVKWGGSKLTELMDSVDSGRCQIITIKIVLKIINFTKQLLTWKNLKKRSNLLRLLWQRKLAIKGTVKDFLYICGLRPATFNICPFNICTHIFIITSLIMPFFWSTTALPFLISTSSSSSSPQQVISVLLSLDRSDLH